MKKLIIAALLISLSGCAALSSTYQHPVTKQTFKCETFGIGWLGTPVAVAMYYDCKDKMEKAGYLILANPLT